MTAPDALLVAVAALVTALVTAWVTLPLWRGPEPLSPPDPAALELLARRQALLAMLRDLDAERALGRLDATEHGLLREEVVAHGAAVLQAIDRLAEAARSASALRLARVEADVHAAGGTGITQAPSCAACGRVVEGGALFCGWCGRPLESGVAAAGDPAHASDRAHDG